MNEDLKECHNCLHDWRYPQEEPCCRCKDYSQWQCEICTVGPPPDLTHANDEEKAMLATIGRDLADLEKRKGELLHSRDYIIAQIN